MIKYNKSFADVVLMSRFSSNKSVISENLNKNIMKQLQCLDEFIKGIGECDKKNLPNTKVIWNISAFVNITSIDLKTTQRDLYASTNDWVQRYYIRQAYLLMYEFFKTYYSENKEFHIIVSTKLDVSSMQAEKSEVVRLVRDFRKKHEKTLEVIRHNTIAHRNGEVALQIKYIEELNLSDSISIMVEFDNMLNMLGAYLNKVIKAGLKDIDLLK